MNRGRYYIGIMEPEIEPLLLDYERAANALSLSCQALRDLVYKGRGPTTVKIGRRTFFTLYDLHDFVKKYRQDSL